jgi:hypothetical protein
MEESLLPSTQHSKTMSHVMLGDSTTTQVSQQIRRNMWMDIESTCNHDTNDDNNDACHVSLKRGMQYGVVLPAKRGDETMKLSKLLPFTSFQDCSMSCNKTRLSIITTTSNDNENVETITLDDWNMDSVVNLSTTPTQQLQEASTPPLLYGNRTLHRPHGVANAGRLVTRMGSSLDCPATFQVREVLPPYIRPLWDTWTLQEIIIIISSTHCR